MIGWLGRLNFVKLKEREMSFLLAKTLLVSIFFVSCISVFGDEIDVLPGSSPPTNYRHGQHHGPVASPSHAPTHAPTHHHKSHPPSHAAHPPTAQPPSHHHHKGHAPVQPPSAQPPTPKHHHPKSPAAAPSHPPALSPSHPPAKPPSRPIPERKLVAVQGVVYCKACKYRGVDTLLGASPLVGAVVRLQCNNSRYAPLIQDGKTDARGYFFIQAKKLVTTYGAHKCKVSLVSSPLKSCNKPTDLHAGAKGAILMKPVLGAPGKPPLPYAVFTVGPFAFEASSQTKCPR